MLNLDFPNQHVTLPGIFACCTAWSQHRTKATGDCLGPPMQKLKHLLEKQTALEVQDLCVCVRAGGTAGVPAMAPKWGEPTILCQLLVPQAVKAHSAVLTGALCRWGGKLHISACKTWCDAGAGPRRHSSTAQVSWELNAVLGAATGHTELSLFKGPGCVSGPRESLNHRQWKQF